MGTCCSSADDGPQDGLGAESQSLQDSEPLAPVELPPGWKAVPSRSRPGKVAYQNIHTGERISWVPTEEAKTYKGGISKKKKKSKKKEHEEENEDDVSIKLGAGNGSSKTDTKQEEEKLMEPPSVI
mmetsp:Transcript_12785/g.20686  ORF Transcript_12785/g.20686 Transcript_12785/m.20686 type:complete len:126 (-) Transcript_12785:112-489(-)|eukprot:CAMPEP_0203765106 /NCGR_PEP_ID=MMETSP0098-20131031/18225_1 /ASSEMBLY_ACC=CAM_ASM_000208 /TAXON_ID=96639 /ORGANISM=" , Strain NY0313808BC1" /LENGTH=125 /DNA_ID=CAMNT_0050661329 /DNA_START=957 /DNA_END=1334 /DNA_ORIENTATION=+